VPADTARHTLVLPYNDVERLEQAFAGEGDGIACVIVEAIAGNMNLVRGTPAFHEALRRLCTKHGALLIFDEVMTGFRVAPGGAQELYGITPDLTTLGKVIGGGMPLAAFGGRTDVMAHLAPLGSVYQAGTLSGNPLAVACGMATLDIIGRPGFQGELAAATDRLAQGLCERARRHGQRFCADAVGSMFGLYFLDAIPASYEAVMQCDRERFNRFFHAMLDHGVYLAPSAFEAGFVSGAHDAGVIDEVLAAADACFAALG
jgi:glutamate-1-semialdehyde 2,1-aminomutase